MKNEKQAAFQKRSPRAIFLENIEQACKGGCEQLLSNLDQVYNKYRLTEGQLLRSQQGMSSKIPQIQKTILMIQTLKSAPNADIDFLISEGVYVKAKPKGPLSKIALWLGSGTIVELSFDEAKSLLEQNLDNAKKSLIDIAEQLNYLKDQKTTTEVNVARVYNYSLSLKRQQQLKAASRDQ